jgi:hypothetical protein
MRKLLVILNTMVRNNTRWGERYALEFDTVIWPHRSES